MKTIIVTFVSEPYVPVGLNWLQAISRLNTGADIRIITLDEVTKKAFPASVVLHRPLESGGLAGLWIHRTAVLRELLDQGFGVVHSDADAVWVRNPLPMMFAGGTEMVFSQGTVWPPDVHARRGIVVCCGLFYMKSTPAVRDFIVKAQQQAMLDMSIDEGFDDQVTINRLIDRDLIKWLTNGETYQIEFRNRKFTASHDLMLSESAAGPNVAVLPFHHFPRIVSEVSPEVVVAHPQSGKTCSEKIKVLTELGLWRI